MKQNFSRVCAGKQSIVSSFILGYFQQKVMTNFLGPFCSLLAYYREGKQEFFRKGHLGHFFSRFSSFCKISEKNKWPDSEKNWLKKYRGMVKHNFMEPSLPEVQKIIWLVCSKPTHTTQRNNQTERKKKLVPRNFSWKHENNLQFY